MTRYVLDLATPLTQVLMERDGAGNPIAYYVHGLGLIARITPTGDTRYYHYDVNGNTVALSNASGQVTDAYAYSPFGELLTQQGATANPFRFLGQFGVMHEGDGTHYVRARYYHPATGRFLGKDPVTGTPESGQTLNPYVYALNNPVRYMDPSGLFSFTLLGIGLTQTAAAAGEIFTSAGDVIITATAAIRRIPGAKAEAIAATAGLIEGVNEATKQAQAAGTNIGIAFRSNVEGMAAVTQSAFAEHFEGQGVIDQTLYNNRPGLSAAVKTVDLAGSVSRVHFRAAASGHPSDAVWVHNFSLSETDSVPLLSRPCPKNCPNY